MTQIPENSSPPKGTFPKIWALVALGFVVTLLAGLAIGLRLRPDSTVVSVALTPTVESVSTAVGTENATATPQNTSPTNADFMTFLLSDARYIDGDANAPVTIVEFSDFK